ncbi:Long-chain fatty acid transport protein [Desulfosarcina cetonica]|nr:Long-chain fatty acid transport protein [Desulfosarcina cetonica]
MKRLLQVVCLTVLSASYAWGANVDTFGIGAKATALGGAFSAYADDPYAIHYNPAGLVQIERPTVSAGVNIIDPTLKVNSFHVGNADPTVNGSTDFEDTSNDLFVPHMGFAMRLTDNWAVGAAFYVPFGLDISWDDNPTKNPGAYNCYHSYYDRVVLTPSVAYKFNEKWSVGLGLVLGKSESGVEHRLYAPGSRLHGSKIESELEDNFNYSFNVGVMYHPTESITMGLTYRSKADTDFEGEVKIVGTGIKSDIELDTVDHPQQVQFGLRFQPIKRVSMEVDVVWTDWSIVDRQTTTFSDNFLGVYGPGSPQDIPRHWNDTMQFKAGIEWQTTDYLALRVGYFYDQSPIPDETFDLVWPDADKKTYSIGFGLNLGRVTVDGVVQYIRTEVNRQIGGESDSLNYTYHGATSLDAEGHLWGYGLTVSYAF